MRARALISGYCICFRSISSEEASASVMVADLSAGRAGTYENDRLGAGGGLRERCAGTRAGNAHTSLATTGQDFGVYYNQPEFVRGRALRLRSASSFLSRCALLYLRSAFFHSIDRSCRCCFCTSSDASRSTTGNVLSSGRRRRSYHTSRARSPFARSSGKSLSRFGGRSSVHSTTALMSGILCGSERLSVAGRRDVGLGERRRGGG